MPRPSLAPGALEQHRAAILAHCYRMLGSVHDAEDVTQDVMLRASAAAFDGRSSVATWLYRIATNACIDQLRRVRRRRELPVGGGTQIHADDDTPAAMEPAAWIEPFPDRLLGDPQQTYLAAETVRLAFVAALQRLAPQPRAVLLLRDVLGWSAREVAVALGITVSAVNSALHRARAIASKDPAEPAALTAADRRLLQSYVRAWVDRDADALVALLASSASFSMPPNPAWLRGRRAVHRYLERVVFARAISRRFVETRANGGPAFAVYTRRGRTGPYTAHAIHVVTLARGRVTDIISFHDAALFPAFGVQVVL